MDDGSTSSTSELRGLRTEVSSVAIHRDALLRQFECRLGLGEKARYESLPFGDTLDFDRDGIDALLETLEPLIYLHRQLCLLSR